MNFRKKYGLTGGGIIVLLIILVFVGRRLHGSAPVVHLNNSKVKGPANARVHMVEYSDFQCTACRAAFQPVEELRSEYEKQIRLEFRHFPLERAHRWSLTAASFAECAAEQGKFWEFHDRLFQEQGTWSVSEGALLFFAQVAQGLRLNTEKLEQCLKNPETTARIRRERSAGEKQGVQSTPTIFINGRPLIGAQQLREQGKAIVEEELNKPGSSRKK